MPRNDRVIGCMAQQRRISVHEYNREIDRAKAQDRILRSLRLVAASRKSAANQGPELGREMPALVLRPTACLISAQGQRLGQRPGFTAPFFQLQANGLLHKVSPVGSTLLI